MRDTAGRAGRIFARVFLALTVASGAAAADPPVPADSGGTKYTMISPKLFFINKTSAKCVMELGAC